MHHCGSYLHILRKLIIGKYVDSGEFSNPIEFELDFNRLTISVIISPANPTLI